MVNIREIKQIQIIAIYIVKGLGTYPTSLH